MIMKIIILKLMIMIGIILLIMIIIITKIMILIITSSMIIIKLSIIKMAIIIHYFAFYNLHYISKRLTQSFVKSSKS